MVTNIFFSSAHTSNASTLLPCFAQKNQCEWQKCPHHKQGYLDPMEPTRKDKEPTASPTVFQCSNQEQLKCCNYEGTLKQAAKYCKTLDCDIADCNNHDGGGYFNDNYNNNNHDGGYPIDLRNDQVSYGDGDGQPNKGPRPDADGSNVDYGGYGDGGDSNRQQGVNTGSRPGNKGSRNGDSDFLNQGVDEDCKEEWTSGQACRQVCTTKVEYKLMGIVMSTHDEVTTKPCN